MPFDRLEAGDDGTDKIIFRQMIALANLAFGRIIEFDNRIYSVENYFDPVGIGADFHNVFLSGRRYGDHLITVMIVDIAEYLSEWEALFVSGMIKNAVAGTDNFAAVFSGGNTSGQAGVDVYKRQYQSRQWLQIRR